MLPTLPAVGIVAIDGPSGAGKSTLAATLVAGREDCLLVSTDEFATWDDPVSWWPELVAGVLRQFAAGEPMRYCPRVWTDGHAVAGPEVVHAWCPVLIVEGMSSARRAMTPHLTRAFWLDGGSPQERLDRAVARDGEQSRDQLRAWQRFEDGWFAVDGTRERCEVVEFRQDHPN